MSKILLTSALVIAVSALGNLSASAATKSSDQSVSTSNPMDAQAKMSKKKMMMMKKKKMMMKKDGM